jgi:hypothetical protein
MSNTVTTLASATALGWVVTDANGVAAAATLTQVDKWLAEKVFTLAGATTAAYASYDIQTPGVGAKLDRKVVHESATTQVQLWAQIAAWEDRMQLLGDKVPDYAERAYATDVH